MTTAHRIPGKFTFSGRYGWNDDNLDVSDVEDVQILKRKDGKVLWVNVDGRCMMRISRINGKIRVETA